MLQRQLLIRNASSRTRVLQLFKIVGYVQMGIGTFVAIFNFGLLFINKEYSLSTAVTYSGFWTGPVFFVAGGLSMSAFAGKLDAKMFLFVIISMVLSVLSAILAAVALTLNISLIVRLSGVTHGVIFPFDIIFQIAFGLEILATIVQIALGFKIYSSVPAADPGSGSQRQLDSVSATVQSTAATPA